MSTTAKRKTCSQCRRRRALTKFCRDKSRKDGLEPRCADCRKLRHKVCYAKHRAKRLAAKKVYNDANRELRRQKQAEYNHKNQATIAAKAAARRRDSPEKVKEQKRRHYDKHREEVLAKRRAARAANPWPARLRDRAYRQRPEVSERQRSRYAADEAYREKRRANVKRCVAVRRGATRTEKIYRKKVHEEAAGRCYLCGVAVLLADMHLEHKHPLSRGGSHTYDNIGCACRDCNLSKQNKTETEFLQYRKELLA